MKTIVLTFLTILILVGGMNVYNKNKRFDQETKEFNDNGQFTQIYHSFNHEEMLLECEKYDLIYDYEDSECMTHKEWEELNNQYQGK